MSQESKAGKGQLHPPQFLQAGQPAWFPYTATAEPHSRPLPQESKGRSRVASFSLTHTGQQRRATSPCPECLVASLPRDRLAPLVKVSVRAPGLAPCFCFFEPGSSVRSDGYASVSTDTSPIISVAVTGCSAGAGESFFTSRLAVGASDGAFAAAFTGDGLGVSTWRGDEGWVTALCGGDLSIR